jgi:hypothetical protein
LVRKGIVLLDAVKTNIIRNSRWRCDHGWDIDLDDGSSNFRIYNNLCLPAACLTRRGARKWTSTWYIVRSMLSRSPPSNSPDFKNITISQDSAVIPAKPSAGGALHSADHSR